MVKPSYNPNNIGSQSRRTGIVAKSSTKRDRNNIEDLDDFFAKNGMEQDIDPESKPAKKVKSQKPVSRKASSTKKMAKSHRKGVSQTSSDSEQQRVRAAELSSNENESAQHKPSRDTISAANLPTNLSDSDINDNDISVAEQLSPIKSRTSSARSNIKKPLVSKNATMPKKNPSHTSNTTENSPSQKKSPRKLISINKNTAKKFSSTKLSKTVKPAQISKSKEPLNKTSEPIRKSSRVRVPPLAFWKNEKVVYEYNKDHVPSIKNVIVLDHEDAGKEKSKTILRTSQVPNKKAKKSNASNSQKQLIPNKDVIVPKHYPNTEWFSGDGHNDLKVFNVPKGKKKVTRTIAWAPNKEVYSLTFSLSNDRFKLAILFAEESEFAASGMLEFPVKGFKSTKVTEDMYFIFFVVSGVLRITISDNVFTVTEGCSFEIPMGNKYSFVNIGTTSAKMFFVQSKYADGSDDDDEEDDEEEEQDEEEENDDDEP